MQCPRCGTENKEGRASCSSCFAPLRAQAAAAKPAKPPKEPKQKQIIQRGPQPEGQPQPSNPRERLRAALSTAKKVSNLPGIKRADFSTKGMTTIVSNLQSAMQALERGVDDEGRRITPRLIADGLRNMVQAFHDQAIWFRIVGDAGERSMADVYALQDAIESAAVALTQESEEPLSPAPSPAQPIPEPPVIVPEAAPEPAFEPAIQAPAEEAPEREPIELDSEPVVLGPTPSFAELVEETPAEEEAEPEPELPPAPGMGFILREMAETPADEQLPAGERSLASLAPPPKPEEPVASAEPPVPEEPPAQKAPLASLAPEPPEDVVSPPGYLGVPPEEEEEDLGVHEPKVFDLGAMPEEEPAEPEPIELEPSVPEPKAFDVGEVLEEEPTEPEPIELEPSVHEPKAFDVGEVPEGEPTEPEPIEFQPLVHEPKAFDVGEVLEEEPTDPEPIELEPSVHEPKAFDLGEIPEEEPAEPEPIELPAAQEPEVFDLEEEPALEPEAVKLEAAVPEPEIFELGEEPAPEPEPEPVELESVVEEPQTLGVAEVEEEPEPIELEPVVEEPQPLGVTEVAEEEPELEPEPIELESVVEEPQPLDVTEVAEEEPEPVEIEPAAYRRRVFDFGVVPKAPPAPTPMAEVEAPEVSEEAIDLSAALEIEEAEEEPPELAPVTEEEVSAEVIDLSVAPETEEAEAEEELPEPPPAESSETEIEPALEEKELEPAATVGLVDADSPAPSPVETVEVAEPEAEQAPLVEAPELPVFDIESIEESPEVEEEKPPTRHRPRSPLPGLAVTLILLLLSAWRFMNSYPPPGAVASNFVKAVDSMMAGDTTALSRVVSADSQQDMGQIAEVFQPFQKKRLEIRITPQEVVRREIIGNSANVVVLTNFGIPDAVQAQGRLTVALVKEGSAIRKRWKVDLTKTGEDWKTELPQLLETSTTPQGEP